MLCPISTGKSGSKWLDRLRSSKGFPTGNDHDLEQFLNHHNPELSNSSHANLSEAQIFPASKSSSSVPVLEPVLDRKNTSEAPRENGGKEWFFVMNRVLAELFNMGDSNDSPIIPEKKISRKQPNPRICALSTLSLVEIENADGCRNMGVSAMLPSSGDYSFVEVKQTTDRLRLTAEENVDVGPVDAEEDEKSYSDLSAFSRAEVTVIDTSYQIWKCEKLLFRRKNVWRVREKKSKSTKSGIKKRKAKPLEDGSGGEKKLKRCSSSTSKDAQGKEHAMPSNGVHLQSEKMKKGHKGTPDILSQTLQKWQVDLFPTKSIKCSSSVIRVKNVPISNKNAVNTPRS